MALPPPVRARALRPGWCHRPAQKTARKLFSEKLHENSVFKQDFTSCLGYWAQRSNQYSRLKKNAKTPNKQIKQMSRVPGILEEGGVQGPAPSGEKGMRSEWACVGGPLGPGGREGRRAGPGSSPRVRLRRLPGYSVPGRPMVCK